MQPYTFIQSVAWSAPQGAFFMAFSPFDGPMSGIVHRPGDLY
ncbi:hypothetical protein DDI_3127 [Dickeya dianthicola RNS04.9]|nr:hypothetical protein DDI_3127 [Dickeya dianthicola RNS04.9]